MSAGKRLDLGVELPWWRVPMVWLVIGGPLLVVIASFVTLGLALKYPDPVLQTSSQAQHGSAKLNAGSSSDPQSAAAEMPAIQARNHAATGGR